MSDKTPAGHVPDEECYAARDERAGREKAEWKRDHALVTAAVLLRSAREALAQYGRHEPCCARFAGGRWGLDPPLEGVACTCGLDAALAALDGGGDVREWLAWLGRLCFLAGQQPSADMDAAVASAVARVLSGQDDHGWVAFPSALPDPTAALTAFAAWILRERSRLLDGRGWEGSENDAAELARRWMEKAP